ncbi:hypothetical protein CPB83DRAFT_858076 [Crepidotus variabilis]|uniref:Uncharacterized protein n=1 Tax=Crepidotus variabilis TaxID=179855 RepID=A0A9P6JMM0_9AGAR|nr:hypothetical protein CPB83DRAFT_858076 [Crepidotus variabilis]
MSARITRQSRRIASLSATATPVSLGSPAFSSNGQSVLSETPITSDSLDDVDEALAFSAKVTKSNSKALSARLSAVAKGSKTKGKRKAVSEDEAGEGEDDQDDEPVVRASKRRAVSTQIYVEVPSQSAKKPRTPATLPRNKGKAKAISTPSSSEDELLPEIDESNDSGSEFELDGELDEAQAEADEEVVLDAAVRLSLQHASEFATGSPSRSRGGLTAGAALRAAAAQRRLANRGKRAVEGGEDDDEELSDYSSSGSSSEGQSLAQIKAAKSKTGKAVSAARKANKVEELAMIQKLGRRLTWVMIFARTRTHLHESYPKPSTGRKDFRRSAEKSPRTQRCLG